VVFHIGVWDGGNNPHHKKISTLRNVRRDLGELFETRYEDVGWINPAKDGGQLVDSCENDEILGAQVIF
jgi:hypothetical protein